MSLFLGTGSESKKCWQVILDSEITHVFQFVGRTSLPLATSEMTEHNPAPSPSGHPLLSGPPTLNDIHQIRPTRLVTPDF